MLAVVAYDGASFDMVAIGANVRDAADAEAPPIPAAPMLTPVAGGVFAEWLDVAAGDLAGYRIYADGEAVLDYIEGGTSIVVPCAEEVEVTLSAVDISGNESDLSDPVTETPLAGEMPVVELTATAASGVRNDVIELAATGGETYDWDVDGDGVWDFTDDATGMSEADTNDLGVIRPAVRAHTADGGFSLSAISLFITGNFRPVVLATADVTSGPPPLDVNFTIVAEDDDGTIEEYAWDFDGDGTFDDSSATDPSPLAHNYPDTGMFNAKFRATDSDGAWAVDTVAVQVMSNQPPVAILTVDETVSYLGESGLVKINFDGSTSYDPEGSTLEYAWDPDGDGNFTGYNANYSISLNYRQPGIYEVIMRVRDVDGAFSETSRNVYVYRWRHYPAETGGRVGYWSSLDVINGMPAMSYYDNVGQDLRYARATTRFPLNAADWETHAVDTAGNVGWRTSLSYLSGDYAVISYYDRDNEDLKFARATTSTPSSSGDWNVHAVDTAGNVGRDTSIRVVGNWPNTRIWISYLDATNFDLKFARSTTDEPSGGGDWVTHTVDSTGDVGAHSFLSADGDSTSGVWYVPQIVYRDVTNGALKFARATSETPSSAGDWVIHTIDDGGGDDVGLYPASRSYIPYSGGGENPDVVYRDATNEALKYARANTPDPASSADWLVYTLDADNNVGESPSLTLLSDYTAIVAYGDTTAGALKVARAKNYAPADETEWLFYVVDGQDAKFGEYQTSIVLLDNKPIIGYMREVGSIEDLMFAIPRLE